MYEKKIFSILMIFVFVIPTKSFAQGTFIIDYFNFRSNYTCNGFANPTSVSGYTYLTNFGTPRAYDVWCGVGVWGTNLFGSSSFVNSLGDLVIPADGYSIAYNFKKGCHYEISVLGKCFNTNYDAKVINVGLSLSTTNGGTNNTCGRSNIPAGVASQYSKSTFSVDECKAAYKWVTPINMVAPQDAQYLLVAAFQVPGITGGASLVIQQIKIVETPTITPTIVAIPCGSITPTTFTVNTGSAVGITGYTWNLGVLKVITKN